ncbi:ABC transporter ATP-binding protein [Pseudoalteromonas spongiae]|uniref:ABC transporter ATP-binding protein n=1 Tax=Pseudoalteromonas spongiae TaxID=298657 RepID=UPI00110A4195|nr:ABC transporter ATP-binding protein [Pseudoalteromonas spongiae]TMO87746.1 ABC transporter ATP-binding protein [Pseudoalteromonas spongiae]
MIELKNVSKHFASNQVLTNVSMTIESGEPVAIIGPNGAGKTTLFSLISGFISPSSGEVLFDGDTIPHAAQFGKLAVLPQDAQLDPRFSIEKQLAFFAKLQGFEKALALSEVTRVLSQVGLVEHKTKKPQELSHGMRKRACIAQALIGNPSFVLLDEATAGLDPIHAKEIRELIASLSSEITFILSSHDLAELERLCQRVFVFEAGSLKQYSGDIDTQNHAYLTLRLKQHSDDFDKTISGLNGLTQIKTTQSREYLIEYDASVTDFDIQLLQHLHQKQIAYQQIYNGKTLENQLFD